MRDTRDAELADALTILWGYHDLLLSGALGPLTERQRSALEVLVDRSRHLAVLFRKPADSSPARSQQPATFL